MLNVARVVITIGPIVRLAGIVLNIENVACQCVIRRRSNSRKLEMIVGGRLLEVANKVCPLSRITVIPKRISLPHTNDLAGLVENLKARQQVSLKEVVVAKSKSAMNVVVRIVARGCGDKISR